MNLEYRMYGLVPYNLSDIQKGIQYGHAVVEYMSKHYAHDDACIKWAKEDKTFIILDGGTTNLGHKGYSGTLNSYIQGLSDNRVPYATFYEPDLGDQLTAIVFLVDERVWNTEKYPDRNLNPGPEPVEMGGGISITHAVHYPPETEESYIERLGGEQNVWLREFLSQFRLA